MQKVLRDVETHDDIAFVPFKEHSILLLERTSKTVLRSYVFLWGNVFDAKRGPGIKNNCGLKGLVNIEITKYFKFFNLNQCSPY
jgi:hypothetical protein